MKFFICIVFPYWSMTMYMLYNDCNQCPIQPAWLPSMWMTIKTILSIHLSIYLSYTGPKLWNSLDSDIKDAPSLNYFKSKLKIFLSKSYNTKKLTNFTILYSISHHHHGFECLIIILCLLAHFKFSCCSVWVFCFVSFVQCFVLYCSVPYTFCSWKVLLYFCSSKLYIHV